MTPGGDSGRLTKVPSSHASWAATIGQYLKELRKEPLLFPPWAIALYLYRSGYQPGGGTQACQPVCKFSENVCKLWSPCQVAISLTSTGSSRLQSPFNPQSLRTPWKPSHFLGGKAKETNLPRVTWLVSSDPLVSSPPPSGPPHLAYSSDF